MTAFYATALIRRLEKGISKIGFRIIVGDEIVQEIKFDVSVIYQRIKIPFNIENGQSVRYQVCNITDNCNIEVLEFEVIEEEEEMQGAEETFLKDMPMATVEQQAKFRKAALDRIEELETALQFIEKWDLPRVNKNDGTDSTWSYEYEYGSNGARDYIRNVARKVLEK